MLMDISWKFSNWVEVTPIQVEMWLVLLGEKDIGVSANEYQAQVKEGSSYITGPTELQGSMFVQKFDNEKFTSRMEWS